MLLPPRNLNFRFFPTDGLFTGPIIDVSQRRRKRPGHRRPSLPLYHCQTMIFYTMSPVERIDRVRGSLRLRAETLQRIIRCAANIARKFHPLLNNFVASSVARNRCSISTSLCYPPAVSLESWNSSYEYVCFRCILRTIERWNNWSKYDIIYYEIVYVSLVVFCLANHRVVVVNF